VVYQARRDPKRREEWFFTPDNLINHKHVFLSERIWSRPTISLYRPGKSIRTVFNFSPTHLLIAGWDTPLSLTSSIYARVTGSPLSLWVESNPSTSRRTKGLSVKYKRFILNSASSVIMPTRQTDLLLGSISGQERRSIFLPNPVNLQRLDSVSDGSSRIIFIGDFSHRKGFDVFLNACRLGAEQGWQGIAWGKDTDNLSVLAPPNCTVNPGRPLAEIIPQLRVSDILVIPSRLDPAPLTFSEALALGLRMSISDAVAYSSDLPRPHIGLAVHTSGDENSLLSSVKDLSELSRPSEVLSHFVSNQRWSSEAISSLITETPSN